MTPRSCGPSRVCVTGALVITIYMKVVPLILSS